MCLGFAMGVLDTGLCTRCCWGADDPPDCRPSGCGTRGVSIVPMPSEGGTASHRAFTERPDEVDCSKDPGSAFGELAIYAAAVGSFDVRV